ncbi:hypothetical protein [Saccharomonospora cyanea]|uniref:hypothetical protein n=1 Tax=Saccharomonospora cyanea TaxID=40989 RepID=UPI00030C8472|nr:hypothetical protein [Saccharomonospora cyanea]
MELDDLDAFGMLADAEPAGPTPVTATLGQHDEHAQPAPSTSVTGDGNKLAQHDVNDYSWNFAIESAVILGTGEPARVRQRSGRGLQDPEALRRLARQYVAPPGLLGDDPGTAFRVLDERNVLFLTAENRSGGQFAAGLRLGHELRKKYPGLAVREELLDPGFRLSEHDLLGKQGSTALVLDLREAGEDVGELRRSLVEFARVLEKRRSFLILMVPRNQVREFDETLPGRVHHLGKPPSVEVLARYLDGVDAHTLVQEAGCAEQLEHLWPPGVKEVAEAVTDRSREGETPAEALRTVLDKQRYGWAPALRKEIRKRQENGDTEWLALLVASAVLEHAEPQHVVTAADQLLAANGVDTASVAPLLTPSPYARLHDFASEHFDPASRKFRPRGFATEVVRHLWREHPELRQLLLDWLAGLPRQINDLGREELERIADRSADLAAEGGHRVALVLARRWATTHAGRVSHGQQTSDRWPDRRRRSIAVRLLTATATDSSLGRAVRQELWEWSRKSDADLQLLTAEVCAGIGQFFPRVALTRLKHLAGARNPDVRKSVVATLGQLAEQLGVSAFLGYLTEWFDNAPPPRLQLLADAAAELFETRARDLAASTAAAFWERALDSMPPENLRTAVDGWLHAADGAPPEQRESLVELLVRATGASSLRIAQVQYASRNDRILPDLRSCGSQQRAETVQLLWTRLDEVDPVWGREGGL